VIDVRKADLLRASGPACCPHFTHIWEASWSACGTQGTLRRDRRATRARHL